MVERSPAQSRALPLQYQSSITIHFCSQQTDESRQTVRRADRTQGVAITPMKSQLALLFHNIHVAIYLSLFYSLYHRFCNTFIYLHRLYGRMYIFYLCITILHGPLVINNGIKTNQHTQSMTSHACLSCPIGNCLYLIYPIVYRLRSIGCYAYSQKICNFIS